MDLFGVKPDAWFPIFTLVLGAAAKAVHEWWTDEHKAKREKEIRTEQRLDALRSKRFDYQRSTLHRLQDCVGEALWLASRLKFEPVKNALPGTMSVVEDSTCTELTKLATESAQLRSRISDEPMREQVGHMIGALTKILTSTSKSDLNEAMNVAGSELSRFNGRVGIVLASIDEQEESLVARS